MKTLIELESETEPDNKVLIDVTNEQDEFYIVSSNLGHSIITRLSKHQMIQLVNSVIKFIKDNK